MITQNSNNTPIHIGTIMLITRLFIALVGLGMTVFGVKYSVEVFLLIYETLQKPDTLPAIIEKWLVVLNIKGLVIADYPLDKLLAIVILAVGALLLLRITLGFIHAGTTILINSANIVSNINTGGTATEKAVINLDYKLSKLKSMADQGLISQQAYEHARDKYLVQKIISD